MFEHKFDELSGETTNGGRALNAVMENQQLSSTEKHILLVFGSQLDYMGTFREYRWVSIKKLMYWTGYSDRTIQINIKKMVDNGYLEKQFRYENNRQQSNFYRLTKRIFEEYYPVVVAKHEEKIRGEANSPLKLTGGKQLPPDGGSKFGCRGEADSPRILPHTNSLKTAPSIFNANGGSAPTPPQKISHKEKAEVRKMGAALFVKTERQRNGFERNITKEEKNALMEECLKDFGIEPLRLFYAKIKEEQTLGEIAFHHQQFRIYIQEIVDGKIDLTPRKPKQQEDEFEAFFTNLDESEDSSAIN